MKICWDNLENLRFNKKTGKWYVDGNGYVISTYHFKEKCEYCGESFLSAKNKENYCCKSCSKLGKGRIFTDEWKRNIGKSTTGDKNEFYGKKHTEKTKETLRNINLGKKHTEKTKVKLSKLSYGRNNGMYGIRRFGEKSPNWKGGKCLINERIRQMKEYALWRKCVFKRDEYICVKCGSNWKNTKGLILNAHHIIPLSENYSTAFVVENGMTLCEKCHKKIHIKGW